MSSGELDVSDGTTIISGELCPSFAVRLTFSKKNAILKIPREKDCLFPQDLKFHQTSLYVIGHVKSFDHS